MGGLKSKVENYAKVATHSLTSRSKRDSERQVVENT